tara:strand:- start:131 stop:1294 length:1164 start_codon:yes stop_codon:yes gene_type:complete
MEIEINFARSRITNLDFIRGFALLGILVINIIAFGLPLTATSNPSTFGIDNTLDWTVLIISSVFFEYKMMGLFSMLFGVGIMIFLENAQEKTTKPKTLAIWRNFILLCFGLIHMSIWIGDVLAPYAICAFLLIIFPDVKKPILIFIAIVFLMIAFIVITNYFSSLYDTNGNLISQEEWVLLASEGGELSYGKFWFPDSESFGNLVGMWWYIGAFFRAISLMLFGILLYKLNIIQGKKDILFYKKIAIFGYSVGLPLSIYSIYLLVSTDYDPSVLFISNIFNTLSVIPMVLGYTGVLTILNFKLRDSISSRLQACGKLAFTNYITQTLFGVFFIGAFRLDTFSRSELIIFVFLVWIIQIAWSKPILEKFNYGPLEWVWRKLTYRFIKI